MVRTRGYVCRAASVEKEKKILCQPVLESSVETIPRFLLGLVHEVRRLVPKGDVSSPVLKGGSSVTVRSWANTPSSTGHNGKQSYK